jgi:hypothetical protein
MTWLRTSLLLWTIMSGAVALLPSAEHPKILRNGACGAIGQTQERYAACRADVPESDQATTGLFLDDLLVPRLAVIGAGYVLIASGWVLATAASRRTAHGSG